MTPFNEIEGAVLEDVSTSEATYVDAGSRSESLKVQGCALDFSLGELVKSESVFSISSIGETILGNVLNKLSEGQSEFIFKLTVEYFELVRGFIHI